MPKLECKNAFPGKSLLQWVCKQSSVVVSFLQTTFVKIMLGFSSLLVRSSVDMGWLGPTLRGKRVVIICYMSITIIVYITFIMMGHFDLAVCDIASLSLKFSPFT